MIWWLAACTPDEPGTPTVPAEPPQVEAFAVVVPSAGLPPEVTPQPANNNLDIVRHDGRLFMAWRTAPTHFASAETEMVVVSTTDEQTWRYEGRIALGTDVREPQLVSWDGELYLHYAVLGANATDFEPQGAQWTRWLGPGQWTAPVDHADPGLLPWRIKELDGRLHLVGYTGGENVYDADGEPVRVNWLVSDDGESWGPFVPGQPVVQEGGGSETDLVFLDDGAIVAVTRNEAGDETGFGSKICRAEAGDLGAWSCVHDPRKYDSPLLFRRPDGRIWLVARRNVTDDGAFDLEQPGTLQEQFLQYSVAYWNEPKRCALWQVDPDALSVTWVLDLPSRGDTCFPEAIEEDDHVLLYNYSSDPDGPDWTWLEGQTRPTFIHRMELWNL